jgi:hypothetical protein
MEGISFYIHPDGRALVFDEGFKNCMMRMPDGTWIPSDITFKSLLFNPRGFEFRWTHEPPEMLEECIKNCKLPLCSWEKNTNYEILREVRIGKTTYYVSTHQERGWRMVHTGKELDAWLWKPALGWRKPRRWHMHYLGWFSHDFGWDRPEEGLAKEIVRDFLDNRDRQRGGSTEVRY